MQTTKDMTCNNQTSGRVSHSGPMMKNRNLSRLTYVKDSAAPRIPSYRANSAGQGGYVGSDQQIMDQQRKELRIFNRVDTMDNSKRQIKIPNDQSWVSDLRDSLANKKLSLLTLSSLISLSLSLYKQYDSGDNKMYMSGPLLAQPSKVDQMLEEHDRQLQDFTRQKAKQSRN